MNRRAPRSVAFEILVRQGRRRRFELATLVEDFNPPLGLFQPRVAEARQLDAAFVKAERLFESELTVLQLLDDRFELGDGGFEVLDGRLSHSALDTLASISPRLNRIRTSSPGWTSEAARTTRRPSPVQHT